MTGADALALHARMNEAARELIVARIGTFPVDVGTNPSDAPDVLEQLRAQLVHAIIAAPNPLAAIHAAIDELVNVGASLGFLADALAHECGRGQHAVDLVFAKQAELFDQATG